MRWLPGVHGQVTPIGTLELGIGNWTHTPSHWNNGDPDLSDDAYINNSGTAQVTSGYQFADDLYLGDGSSDSGHVSMTGGYLRVEHDEYIGYDGTGTFTQSNGENRCSWGTSRNDLHVGYGITGNGTYTMTGGTLYAGDQYIGESGTGSLLQSGGINYVSATGSSSADHLYIGGSGGSGTYRLSNTGELTFNHNDGDINVGYDGGTGRFEWFREGGITIGTSNGSGKMDVGTNGTLAMGYNFNAHGLIHGTLIPLSGLNYATLEVTNGKSVTQSYNELVQIKHLRIGSSTGSGIGYLSDGTVKTTSDQYIGDAGTGAFYHSGGTNDVDGRLYVGCNGGTGTYVLSGSGTSLNVDHHEHIGYGSTGTFTQTGGSNSFSTNHSLTVGWGSYGNGIYRLSGGTINGGTVCVGDTGATGRFEWFRTGGMTVTGMTLSSNGTLAMGADFNMGSLIDGSLYNGSALSGLPSATLEVTNNATATHAGGTSATVNYLDVGTGTGSGTYNQTGGANTVNQNLQLGADAAYNGTYSLTGGTLNVSGNIAAGNGTATMILDGGTLSVGGSTTLDSFSIAEAPGSNAAYGLADKTLTIRAGTGHGLFVGVKGSANLTIGDTSNPGTINQSGGGDDANLTVRETVDGYGELSGWGTVGLGGTLTTSGRIVADGYGTSRTLDMSSFKFVVNAHENPTEKGANGWTAVNQGKLVLPTIGIQAGSYTCNWGESSYESGETTIDLVNSVQMAFEGVENLGKLSISLLAEDHSEVPTTPPELTLIGVWDFTPLTPIEFESADLTFRYDDALAERLGIEEDSLQVFHYMGDHWQDVTDWIDTDNKWIYTKKLTSLSPFGIGMLVPEPATLTMLALAAVAVLLWRRRSAEVR